MISIYLYWGQFTKLCLPAKPKWIANILPQGSCALELLQYGYHW